MPTGGGCAAWHAEPNIRFFCASFGDGIAVVRVSDENFIVITTTFSGDDEVEATIGVGPERTCACKISVSHKHLAPTAPDAAVVAQVLKSRVAEVGVQELVKEVTSVDDRAQAELRYAPRRVAARGRKRPQRAIPGARRITGRGRSAAARPRAVVAGVQRGAGGRPPAGHRAKPLTDGDSDGKGGTDGKTTCEGPGACIFCAGGARLAYNP